MKSLEPIADFNALHTLLRVLVRGCQVCGGDHEGTLVEKNARRVPVWQPEHVAIEWAAGWLLSPAPPCVVVGGRAFGRTLKRPPEYVITPVPIAEGRVFRIVDGDEKARAVEHAKPKKLERIR